MSTVEKVRPLRSLSRLVRLAALPSRGFDLVHYGGSGRPVVLVHGMHSASEHLSFWADFLVTEGWSCYAFRYPTALDLDSIADHLAASALEVSVASREPCALVGHSLGGVLAALATVEHGLGASKTVGDVAAVCSPFGGSPWSRLASMSSAPDLVRQLQHGSPSLSALRARLTADKSPVRWASASATLDLIVPAPSAILPHPRSAHVGLPGEDHLSVLVSDSATKFLSAALA